MTAVGAFGSVGIVPTMNPETWTAGGYIAGIVIVSGVVFCAVTASEIIRRHRSRTRHPSRRRPHSGTHGQ